MRCLLPDYCGCPVCCAREQTLWARAAAAPARRPDISKAVRRPGVDMADQTDDQLEVFHAGRRQMLAAFVELSDAARWAGVEEDLITGLHGRFFDGNVAVKNFAAKIAGAPGDRPAR